MTPIAQGIPQLSIIALIPQLFDFSELLYHNAATVNRDRYNAYCLYFSWRPGHVSQISIILSRGTPSPRPTPTPTQKHTAAVMSRDKPHKAVSIIQRPLNYSRD